MKKRGTTMLVSMKSILEDANKNYYGVMAMNSINIEMARAGIEAAAEQRSPIIIQFGPGQMKNHAHKEENDSIDQGNWQPELLFLLR